MKTAPRGLALIKQKEGFRAKWYYCAAHKPTIGYGHVILASEKHLYDAVLSEADAVKLLAKDLNQYEQAVNRAILVPLNQNQFDALVTLCYNIGTAGLAGSSVVRKINARASEATIRESWYAWNKVDATRDGKDNDGDGKIDEPGEKRVLPALVTRRKEEADLFFQKS